jgi:hypothetical protein
MERLTKKEVDNIYVILDKKQKLEDEIFRLIAEFEEETKQSIGGMEVYYLPMLAEADGVYPNGIIDDNYLYMNDDFNNLVTQIEDGELEIVDEEG